MKRRTTIVVAVVALLAMAVGGWFASTRFAPPDRQLLVGKWEGKGRSLSLGTFGADKVKVGFASTSKAEFRSDGTYTWETVATSGGEGAQMTLRLSVPKDGEPPPKWEIVRKDGRTYLTWHMGESELEFQGKDAFTIRWSQPDDEGSETYRRVP